MINSLLNSKNPYSWTIFHILLGIISVFTKWILIIYFFIVFLNLLTKIQSLNNKVTLLKFIKLFSYLASFELLVHLTKTSPIIPYEMGKYLVIGASLLGIVFSSQKIFVPGLLMIFLIIPAFFYDFSGLVLFSDIVFNGFAPLGLALGVTFLGSVKIDMVSLTTILRLIWYTSISALAFVVFKTPDFDQIYFGLGANFDTTGGESSNQVASILGLGMFLSLYSWLTKSNFSGNRILDLIIVIAFTFQGLLTFSRGGILVGLVATTIFYVVANSSRLMAFKNKLIVNNAFFYVSAAAIVGVVVFQQVNDVTGGKLTQRYLGETEGTLLGNKEKNLDVITSNRLSIFSDDINLWGEYPISGVGVGASQFLRRGAPYQSHVELSRLLSEHGVLGFSYFILLVYLGFRVYKLKVSPAHRSIVFSLFFIGFATSFHSATRTYTTPLLIALSTMQPGSVIPNNKRGGENSTRNA